MNVRAQVRSVLVLLLIVTLVAGFAVGCAKKAETPPAKEEPIKVAYVTAAMANSGSYEITHYAAFQKMVAKYGFVPTLVENVNYGQTPEIVRGLASQGNKMIVTLDAGQATGFYQVADEFPNVWFVIMSFVESTEGKKNVAAFVPNFKEAGYLCGVVGAMKSKTGKLGIVSGEPIKAIEQQVDGWKLGAQSVNPAADVQIRYTQSWVDNSKSKEAALSLIAGGADVLMAATPAENGVYEAAREKAASVIGYYSDCHDRSETVITSYLVKCDNMYDKLGELFKATQLEAKIYLSGIATDAIGMAMGHGRITPEIEQKIQQVIADFKSGKITVN